MSSRIAVIGAGFAGLACAQELLQSGHEVALFDKGRGLGGRCATRRGQAGAFDHGAQFATAETDAFRAYLAAAEAEGAAARWSAAEALRGDGRARHVGLPGMSGLAGPLAAGLDVQHKVEVTAVLKTGGGWALGMDSGDAEGSYDALVLAIPAPQAARLLADHALARETADVAYAPCWAGLFAFSAALDAPDILEPASGPVAWAARQGGRPGHEAGGNAWVVHARADWSRDNLERDASEIAPLLLEGLAAALGAPLPAAPYASAHRWRYALVERPLGRDFLWDGEDRVGLAGDWCIGPRVEAAYTSGRALAAAIGAP